MRVLFLSLGVHGDDARDSLVYTFIEKEMRKLSQLGDEVYFITRHIDEDVERAGVRFLSRNRRLESIRALRALGHVGYVLRNLRFFWRFLLRFPRRTLSVAGHERCIERVVRSMGIDILHTHFLFPAGECGVITAGRCGIPVVATLRGAELRRDDALSYGSMRNAFFREMATRCVPRVGCLTAPNSALVREAREMFSIAEDRVELLANGVEVDIEPRPHAPVREDGPLRLIAVGRLIPLKNHGAVIRALAEVPVDVSLQIVGRGPQAAALRRLASECGTEVDFTAEMDRNALLSLIAEADALIHPSLSEGMPNVVLESLALGVPCLVSSIPAHQDVIEAGRTGFFFDPTSVSDIARLLASLAADRGRLAAMRAACISSASRFSLDRKVERYREIYRMLLDDAACEARRARREAGSCAPAEKAQWKAGREGTRP